MKRRKKQKQNHKLFACFGIMIFLNAINVLNLQKLRANRDRNFKDN